ncbi:MAG: PH domain-containing protein [Candidatus Woesearchaeota archaeon]|jgi:uncharacterized membrane protein YdbT with pleckstrin-like domain
MFDLDHHLDSDEKMLLFFRPSRKAYVHHYLFHFILIVVFIYFSIYFSSQEFISIAFLVLLIIPIAFLLRLEYRIFSRRYGLTNERLLYSNGIFMEKFNSIQYYAITDISFSQSLWDKIMNTGTLCVNTGGGDDYEIRYRKVNDPLKVKRMMNDCTPKRSGKNRIKQDEVEETLESKEDNN